MNGPSHQLLVVSRELVIKVHLTVGRSVARIALETGPGGLVVLIPP